MKTVLQTKAVRMLKLPLVSFIVTSYNYEKFLYKTLESIKNQSYKNFEIIIVDDASSDNSVNIAEEFIAQNQDLPVPLSSLLTNSVGRTLNSWEKHFAK